MKPPNEQMELHHHLRWTTIVSAVIITTMTLIRVFWPISLFLVVAVAVVCDSFFVGCAVLLVLSGLITCLVAYKTLHS